MLRAVLFTAIAAVAYLIVTTPLDLVWQGFTAVGFAVCAILLRRTGRHFATYSLMALSVLASSRYLWWRLTETLPLGQGFQPFELALALGLIAAELYAYVILLFGYFQTARPLKRKPVPLPEEVERWPTVDVFIPTYNEPLSVVRPTILAALALDWPRDKIKIHVLDDGRREDFRVFCAQAGVAHLTRADNKHAKAGNINAALRKTTGELIAIFDCDHIPTRSFLQMTVGVMVADPKVSLVQTPHHFFSPDPFERNLGTFRQVPNEGELFYGLIQDGNDYWNAAFFCGSCAVLRRTALEEIGGIAVETVTEDAHTSLKMHARGWKSAYINVPQAAGLATESLSAHVGQRIRWARGMAQIFRVDNPFLKRGLAWGQRICYANAMLHFMFGLPRLVFLTAPLGYLLLGADIIQAQGLMVLAYAMPHIVLATMTNSHLQGPFRHSFWSEAYETVLATFILWPTLLALINPKLGKFNVTAKGGIVDRDYFDKDIAKPYYLLFLLNVTGIAVGLVRMVLGDGQHQDTLLLNIGWTLYNLVIIGCALAVASERRQVRNAPRILVELAGDIRLHGDSRVYPVNTRDVSNTGLAIDPSPELQLAVGDKVELCLMPERVDVWIPARVTRLTDGLVGVEYEDLSIAQESALVYALFGRADAWIKWRDNRAVDRPLAALAEVFHYGLLGTSRFGKWFLNDFIPGLWRRTPAPSSP